MIDLKGFKKDGKFRPTGNKSKSSLSKADLEKRNKAGIKFYHGTNERGLEGLLNDQKPNLEIVPVNPIEDGSRELYETRPEAFFGAENTGRASGYGTHVVKVTLSDNAKVIGEDVLLKYHPIPSEYNQTMTDRHLWIHQKAKEQGYDVVVNNLGISSSGHRTFRVINPDAVEKIEKVEE